MKLKYISLLPFLSILSGAAYAGSDGSASITYSSIDTSLTAGGATVKGDGNAFTTGVTMAMPLQLASRMFPQILVLARCFRIQPKVAR